jgi:hypothetical protein
MQAISQGRVTIGAISTMPNIYSAIGLPLASIEDLMSLLKRELDMKHILSTNDMTYSRCASASGAELWVQLDLPKHRIVRVNPHFAGESRILAQIDECEQRQEEGGWDGIFRTSLSKIGDPEVLNEFVFDIPDVGLQNHLVTPVKANLQVAAFALELHAFETEEEFSASKTNRIETREFGPLKLAAGICMPEPDQPYAMLSGTILHTETRTNEWSGLPFSWSLVRTHWGDFDVLAAQQVASTLREGMLLRGGFWLSARVVQD